MSIRMAANINNNDEKQQRKQRPIVGVPSQEDSDRHKEKALGAGRRRTNQGVIDLRDTGDNNFMKVVKERHERRRILDNEAVKGLPESQIYNPKQPINSREMFKNEKNISNPTKRKPDGTPSVTQG